ncbi:hypothetical protein EOD39_12661 [Acipenser ruthenus]|uniref:Uncharacterized protein n=1 Tax=Acipenser ruthenus TaxID=7906 RepID=A0A662YQ64_ACIRT|nr:hypothetical protein EOD39_12661 [Acipenser ruthenus]
MRKLTTECKTGADFEIVRVERQEEHLTRSLVLEEPLLFNPCSPVEGFQSGALCSVFMPGGVTKLKHLLLVTAGQWREVESLARQLGVHSLRVLDRVLNELKDSFSPRVREVLGQALAEKRVFEEELACPGFLISPAVPEDLEGSWCNTDTLKNCPAHSIGKKQLYQICVKVYHLGVLRTLPENRWLDPHGL